MKEKHHVYSRKVTANLSTGSTFVLYITQLYHSNDKPYKYRSVGTIPEIQLNNRRKKQIIYLLNTCWMCSFTKAIDTPNTHIYTTSYFPDLEQAIEEKVTGSNQFYVLNPPILLIWSGHSGVFHMTVKCQLSNITWYENVIKHFTTDGTAIVQCISLLPQLIRQSNNRFHNWAK